MSKSGRTLRHTGKRSVRVYSYRNSYRPEGPGAPGEEKRSASMTDWKALGDAEDHAYFMADLMDISPESFTLEEK